MLALDRFDLALLAAIQQDAARTNAQLGEIICLSPSQVSRRLQTLRETGYIEGTVAVLSARALGLRVGSYVLVTLHSHAEAAGASFRELVRSLPEVLECCSLTGDADYLLKIRTTDLDRYSDLLNHKLLRNKAVATVRSSIILEEVKTTNALPLPI